MEGNRFLNALQFLIIQTFDAFTQKVWVLPTRYVTARSWQREVLFTAYICLHFFSASANSQNVQRLLPDIVPALKSLPKASLE